MHVHSTDDAGKAPQHVIESDEAVWQNHALDRGMRDVALVPQGDVLERRMSVRPNQPREAADLLAADRIALVRHRRRALLALPERLLDLANLRLLQPADFEREFLERCPSNGQRRQKLRMTIALDDLRRDRLRLESETAAHVRLDRRRQMRERAHSARQLPDAHRRPRATDAVGGAENFAVPERELQPECHRLRVHAMRAADHRRVPVLQRAVVNRVRQFIEILQDHIARLAHLQRLRRVDDVRRRHPEVEPAGRRPHMLGHRRRERDHVVLSCLFDFVDAGDVKPAALADVARGVFRHDAGRSHRFGRGDLDAQPGLIATLVAPDATHLRVGVALNQSNSSRSFGSCRPFTLPSTVAASEPFRNKSVATRCTSFVVTRSMP